MALRIGIVGLGFMGKMHFDVYSQMKTANVAAICELDAKKRRGDWSSIAGNLGAGSGKQDLSGIAMYSSLDRMLAEADLDVVDVTLPTYLHAEASIAALKAGRNVFCEKPMALNSADCGKMIAAARKARKKLFVGHCIRYWPEFAKMRQIVRGKRYGRVTSAIFTRIVGTPTWSYQGWLLDGKRSGGAALDLHIHDADFVLYLLGKPRSVVSHGCGMRKGQFDHIVTCYEFAGNTLVSAEGTWEYPPTYPFSMSFRIVMEKATLALQPEGLMLFPAKGAPKCVKVDPGDGFGHELRDFVDCVAKNRKSEIVTPESAMRSVKLVEAEIKSATTGKAVKPVL